MSEARDSFIQDLVAAIQYPEIETGDNVEGLVQGYITRHIDADHPLIGIASIGRSVCDVILLITAYEDNTADISMLHFYPSRRVATSIALNDAKDKKHKPGSRFALWIKSQPTDSEQAKQYGYSGLGEVFMQKIKGQLREFLGQGQEPDLVTIDLDYIFQDEEVLRHTNLLLSAARVESRVICRVSTQGTGYHKELLFINGQLQDAREQIRIFVDPSGNVTQSAE